MGENIYGDKKYGLRELIQNSVDACKVMLELSQSKPEFLYTPYNPFINIILDKDKKQVSIFDNGIGMSLDILKKYFLNVGVSYYLSDDYKLKGNQYNPIGNYGIGFLSCFMLSRTVTVITKYYGESKLNRIEIEKNSEYVCLSYEDSPRINGTEIILDYDEFMSIFSLNPENIKKFIEDNFINCGIPIKIIKVENGNNHSDECCLYSVMTDKKDIVRIDDYLVDVQGHLEVNFKTINFISKLKEFNWNPTYIYDIDSKKLRLEDDIQNLNIKKYLKTDHVKYLSIPIISSDEADHFEKACEILEDFNIALSKINTIKRINIFCEDYDLFPSEDTMLNSMYNSIIGEYYFENLCEDFDHYLHTETKVYVIEEKIIQTDSKKIIPFNENVIIGEFWSKKDKIFIKNVYISQFKIAIPFLISGITIKGALFNIFNKNIVPNVARNNVGKRMNTDLAYAVGKALHLWLIDNGGLTDEEKVLIKKFVETYYSEDNNCLKGF